MFTLRKGRFIDKNGDIFIPVGFNYHPKTVGCHLWKKWQPDQIEKDMAEVSRLGFNTVRFFYSGKTLNQKEANIMKLQFQGSKTSLK